MRERATAMECRQCLATGKGADVVSPRGFRRSPPGAEPPGHPFQISDPRTGGNKCVRFKSLVCHHLLQQPQETKKNISTFLSAFRQLCSENLRQQAEFGDRAFRR